VRSVCQISAKDLLKCVCFDARRVAFNSSEFVFAKQRTSKPILSGVRCARVRARMQMSLKG